MKVVANGDDSFGQSSRLIVVSVSVCLIKRLINLHDRI